MGSRQAAALSTVPPDKDRAEELVMMQASPARGLDLAKTFLPFILALSIFSIVSGLDQSPDTQLAHGNVQRELSDHEVIRKEREALPKDQNGPKDKSKKKKQVNRTKKKINQIGRQEKEIRKIKTQERGKEQRRIRKQERIEGKRKIKLENQRTRKRNR